MAVNKKTAKKSTAQKRSALKTTGAKKPAKRVLSAAKLPPAKTIDSPVPTRPRRGRPPIPKAHILSSKLVFDGRVMKVYRDKVIEPNGVTTTREIIHHVGSVVILAVDSSKKTRNPDVILIRQYRHAAGQYLVELPAGRIEPAERPLAAAKREMIEETGFRARKWTLLTRYFASPGFLGESMHIFLAENITEGTAQPEGDEDIALLRMPLADAMRLVAAGKIHDGKTLIGLSLFAAALKSSKPPARSV